MLFKTIFRGCLHEKTRIGANFIPGWLFDFVSLLHDDWVISSLYLKEHFMLIKYRCDSKSQTLRMRYPFQSTRSRLHDSVARFRAGVKFLPRYNNRGELTPGWLAPAWHFLVVSCKQIQSHEREPEWTRAGVKVAAASCKHPLTLGPVPVVCCNGWQGYTWIKTWKSWARFFKFQCNACKTHQKLLYSVLLCKFVWYILHNSTGACALCMGKGTKKFKPQYPHTNSPNWSLYKSLKNELREFNNRSKNFLLGDHFINSHNLSFDNVWILLGENWCWSLLGLKGLKDLHSVCEVTLNSCDLCLGLLW